ncbi:MAG: carbohydrate-binding domain-containing protein [Lachnospiraceae bacterium]|nr:carbohydrate-binding domain-containing protein [Lachnospiraceae bacterium]
MMTIIAVLVTVITILTGCAGSGTLKTDMINNAQSETVQTESVLSEEVAAQTEEEKALSEAEEIQSVEVNTNDEVDTQTENSAADDSKEVVAVANTTTDGIINAESIFTKRDLTQTADLSEAVYYTVNDGEDIYIDKEGVYVFAGSAKEVTIYVEAASDAKVQLVFDGADITNSDFPCVYVKSGDKVFITTSADSALTVTGSFTADDSVNTDAVIFSRSDITLNGTATLSISSTDNGIAGKDDVKVTGGTYEITAKSKAIEANDSICISDGTFIINAGTDGLHAENEDDDSLGYIYICGGTFTINAGDDAIHAVSVVQIDDGTFTIKAAEGIEGTYLQINGGAIDIYATDDGFNAAKKSGSYYPTIEINDGEITVSMASGDTDGIDSNGNIIVNGGTINVTGSSTFDCDGNAEYNGGTIIVNGQQVNSIPTQMMGGMGQGGMNQGGQMGGMGQDGMMGGMNQGGMMGGNGGRRR